MAGETAIDFARSSVAWLLPEQPSHGWFALDAVLRIGEPERAAETWVLGAQVFAGNVYAGTDLFKDPPYGFAAAFSSLHYRIFRDAVRDAPAEDSVGRIDARFRHVDAHIAVVPCERVTASIAGARLPAPDARLSARLRLPPEPGGEAIEMEFPVRHLNVDAQSGRFQVETGPVLALEAGEGDAATRLRRAYVNFGRTDSAELLLDSPRAAATGARWSRKRAFACEIDLFLHPVMRRERFTA